MSLFCSSSTTTSSNCASPPGRGTLRLPLSSPPHAGPPWQLRSDSLVHFVAARMTLPRSSLVSRSEVRPCHRALARIVQLPVPTIGSGFPPSCASTSRLHPASFSHSRQYLTPLLLPAAAAFSTSVRRSATRARVRSSAISLPCCSLARLPARVPQVTRPTIASLPATQSACWSENQTSSGVPHSSAWAAAYGHAAAGSRTGPGGGLPPGGPHKRARFARRQPQQI